MTSLGELLGKFFFYVHTTLGGFYTGLLLGIATLIGGIIIGSLAMFWLVSWVSTRIRRDDDFPFSDRISTLGFEIGGKRVIKAPYAKTVKESMTIILDAILWTLFKRKTLRRKSALRSQIVFCSVAGVVMILVFGSFVSTSHALVGGVKRSYHHYIVAEQNTQKNQPQLVSVHKSHKVALGPSHKKVPKQIISMYKTDRSVKKELSKSTEPRVKVSENKQEKQETGHNVAKHLMKKKRLIKSVDVDVDGHPLIETDDEDKILNTVKSAVESGVKEIDVKVRL